MIESDVKWVDRNVENIKEPLIVLAHDIWGFAELSYQEKKSSEAILSVLQKEGFCIESNLENIETAFVGEYGYGEPVIGFLGEYDALDGLSQVESVTKRQPIVEGAPGHGCGHHALGVGALAGAIVAKRYLEAKGCSGTIRYYGCPAEEGGAGKVYLAQAKVFDDCACTLTWHPTCYNSIWSCNFLATGSFTLYFYGVSAHSTMQGHLGRSALEAVELTSVGANYLRGHVERDVFFNGAVLDAGGKAPNIIPSHAAVTYLVRASTQAKVHDTILRLYDIARGAALMTGTELKIETKPGLSELVPNRTLERLTYESFREIGIPKASKEDIEFAKEIRKSFPANAEESTFSNLQYLYGEVAEKIIPLIRGKDIDDVLYPYTEINKPKYGSTDVCDVSWFTPTVQLTVACYAKDTPGHSWQIVTQGKRNLCMNGMLTAGKVLGLTAIKLLYQPQTIKKIRDEFVDSMKNRTYICPIPNIQ